MRRTADTEQGGLPVELFMLGAFAVFAGGLVVVPLGAVLVLVAMARPLENAPALGTHQGAPAHSSAPQSPSPLPEGWERVAGTGWVETSPAWTDFIDRTMPADDPHRAIRLRVGCEGPRQPIVIGLAHPPNVANRANFRVETLGWEAIFDFQASGRNFVPFPNPLQILSAMRTPAVTAVAISSDVATYGLRFDLGSLEAALAQPEVRACDWSLVE